MKNGYKLFFLLLITMSIYSCKESGDGIDVAPVDTSTNLWIEGVMRNNYYWNEEMPSKDALNLEADPSVFFRALLSNKDGKLKNGIGRYHYSSIFRKTATIRNSSLSNNQSLGFEFKIYHIESLDTYALHVLYILPNSPASRSKLKRSDWILTINDQPIDVALAQKLHTGITAKLGISQTPQSDVSKVIMLTPDYVLNNPVLVDTVYQYEGRKIAYLVYNHFTQGINKNDPNDETFNNTLRTTFSKFKKNRPDDFILDLRFNQGGIITSAQLLATMLAPASALGDVFCNLTYNRKNAARNRALRFDTDYMKKGGVGENLNLQRLFVITSMETASASEAVINGLKPFFGENIIIVGNNTEGKNVGSVTYTDNRFGWDLHPIVCLVSNKYGLSDYQGGFTPNFQLTDTYYNLYDLGDTREYILTRVLNYITKNEPMVVRTANSLLHAIGLTPVESSLDYNKTNGLIVSNNPI
ncbi:MAG: hypothetical protein RL662_1320 [Bacteroidota bacterium]|jgi:hypothetical protein